MRAAFLVSSFPILSETFVLDQVTGLLDRGWEVEIFADERPIESPLHPEFDAFGLSAMTHLPRVPASFVSRPFQAAKWAAQNLSSLRLPHFLSLNFPRYGLRAASLRLFFEATVCMERAPFDIIHCHFGPNALRGLALRDAGALQGKLVTTFYGYDVSEFLQRKGKNPYLRLFQEGELFLALSESMRSKLIDLGCDRSKVRVHRLGVRPEMFASVQVSGGSQPVRILTIGRMVEKKGIAFALRAIAVLVSQNIDLQYRIIGDGPLRAELEGLVDELGLRGVVSLNGWQPRPEVVNALQLSDILLAPSITAASGDQEGTPVVILEAMASGIPVVSTLHAGIPEVIEDGISGILVPERDPINLSKALLRLIESAPLRASMGRDGRRAVQQRHDINILNDQLVEFYRELVH